MTHHLDRKWATKLRYTRKPDWACFAAGLVSFWRIRLIWSKFKCKQKEEEDFRDFHPGLKLENTTSGTQHSLIVFKL